MNMRCEPARAFLVFAILATFGCSSNSPGSTGASTYTVTQVGGSFSLLSQNCYADPNLIDTLNDDSPFLITQIQSYTNLNWRNVRYVDDTSACFGEPKVNASYFTDSTAYLSDFIWYTGHGDAGGPIFWNYTYANHLSNPEGGSTWFNANDIGLPWATPSNQSGLKWIFFNASQSARMTTADSVPWTRAFNTFQSGIHGVYGFEGSPSSGAAGGTPGQQLVRTFLDGVLLSTSRPNPLNIRSGWINAASVDGTGDYGVFELTSAQQDQLSGLPNGSSPPFTTNSTASISNPLLFYDPQGIYTIPTGLTSTLGNSSPGSYATYSLTTENVSDSYLASKADQYEAGSTKYYASSNEYVIASKSYVGSHYEASAAVIAQAPHSNLPYTYTQTDALNFAISELQQNGGGLPSDAVLYRVDAHMRIDNSGTSTLMGYEFYWRHASDMRGGDQIIVGIDNQSRTVCSDWEVNACGHKYCASWQTVYDQRVNFMYRLWRTIGIHPLSVSGNSVSPAQAFSQASSQQPFKGAPNLGTFLGYTYGYWTPAYYSTDNTAYPAYNFYFSSGTRITADAQSGQIREVGH